MNNLSSREKKLQALLDATQILNSSQCTDQILNSLLELSIDLIEGGDTGCIFLYNDLLKMLEMYAYTGMGDSVKDLKLLPGESMTGLAFTKKKAILFPDRESVKKHMVTISTKNKELLIEAKVNPAKVYSSICCPLIYRNETLGVLVIDNFKNKAPLTNDDLELLKAISVQATIAVINAMNLEKEHENNEKLENYNKIIENQKNMYKFSTHVHETFTDMVLKGSSFNDILEKVKQLTGKDLLLIDFFYNISNHTFGKTLPPVLKNIRPLLIQRLSKQSKSKFVEPDTGLHFFAFPIMVNKETMGWLCLLGKSSILAESEIIAAERSATILAIEILKQNELTDLEQSLKGDFLDSLLTGKTSNYFNKCSEKYQYNVKAKHRILLIKFLFGSFSNIDSTKHEKYVRNYIKNYYAPFNEELQTLFPGSIALIRRHYIVCILESDQSGENHPLEGALDLIKTKFHQNYSHEFRNLHIQIGVGEVFSSKESFKEAYENTEQAIKTIKNTDEPIKLVFFKDIEIKRFLLANKRESLQAYFMKLLSPLLNYDYVSKNDFIETLEIYLKSNCNWSESKDLLHIHGNTLTYRLNRISEILNIDLKNYQDRLRLQIAFEIKSLLDE